MTIPRGSTAKKRPVKKSRIHKHKYQENPKGLFFCRCGRVLALGFLGQVMLD